MSNRGRRPRAERVDRQADALLAAAPFMVAMFAWLFALLGWGLFEEPPSWAVAVFGVLAAVALITQVAAMFGVRVSSRR